jgi:uncharacterized protein
LSNLKIGKRLETAITMVDAYHQKLDSAKSLMLGRRILVAFSGGVDSSVLAALAKESAKQVLLLTVNSPTVPDVEKETADRVAKELGLDHESVEVDWLGNEELADNPENRCYLCKKQLAQIWKIFAKQKGLEIVVEGSNVTETQGYRPGAAALKEEGILSPFLEAKMTKDEIRRYAREKHISVAELPSMACLATRFPYGSKITQEKLDMVERMECAVAEVFGIGRVRARYHGDIVRIEVGESEFKKIFDKERLERIDTIGKSIGFRYVTFDAKGYRTGSMDT